MALSDHVQLVITIDNVGIARAGFGVPMILSHNAAFSDRVRYYSSIAGVADDFDDDSPEYLAAAAAFAQTPHPRQVAIGRALGSVTQRYDVEIVDVRDEHPYQLRVSGEGFADTVVEVESDEDATADEIVADFVTALNAVPSRNYTASAVVDASDADTLRIVGNAPGNWLSVQVLDVTAMSISQTHAAPTDTTLATDLSAILSADAGWYCLLTLYNSPAYVLAVAAWAESNKRIYVVDVNDTASITTTVSGATDTLAQLFELGYTRTMGGYHPRPAAMFSDAWMGRWLPTQPGQATAKFKTLSGVEAVTLTDTHRTNLIARRANSYQAVAGRNITWEGTVFSTVNAFLDVTRNVDWIDDEVSKAQFGVLAGNDIVPYTAEGITLLEGALRGSLDLAIAQGVLSVYAVEAPAIEDVSPADKAARVLSQLKFSGGLAGAIHAVIPLTGVVTH